MSIKSKFIEEIAKQREAEQATLVKAELDLKETKSLKEEINNDLQEETPSKDKAIAAIMQNVVEKKRK